MPDVTLIRGPYRMPRCRLGGELYCSWRGDVAVCGFTDAPVPWPYHVGCRQKPLPILCGDLVTAVQTESVAAVAYHWKISRYTVRRWRRHLDVPRTNPGTLGAYQRQTEKLEHARECLAAKLAERG